MPEDTTNQQQEQPAETEPGAGPAVEPAERGQAEQASPVQEPGVQEPAAQEPSLPEPKVAVEEAGTLRKKVTVTVSRERIDAKFDEMFGQLGRTAQVPGFRIGRAPRRLVEKRFGREVTEDVRNALIGESMGQALEQAALKAIGQPEIDLEKIELPEEGELAYCFEVEVAPEFDLPEYKGIEVPRPTVEVTDQRVEGLLAQTARRFGVLRPTDQPARADDQVVVDVRITGEGIDQRVSDVELRVAPAQVEGVLLEDLPKALADHKAGQAVQMKTQVPAAHPNADWRDKDVTVAIQIRQVNRLEVPELNDEFARQVGRGSLADLRQAVRERMERQVDIEQRRLMRQHVCRRLLERATFDVPASVAARHSARVLARRTVDLMAQGVPREQIERDIQELEASAAEQAAQELKLSFILGRIADQEKIEVEEGEINARIAEMAGQYNRRPERLRHELAQEGRLEDVGDALREEKTLDRILESAKVIEAPAPGEEDQSDSEPEGGQPARETSSAPPRPEAEST